MGLLISAILLILFSILAFIDGFYLHIFKYQLFNHEESKLEHLTHTMRSILFPLIVYFLFIHQSSTICFYAGMTLVILDIIVLIFDAYMESESRSFMVGLPRWEYILHLIVNGFLFASIAVFLVLKLNLTDSGISLVKDLSTLHNFKLFHFVANNILPGAVLLTFLHIFISTERTIVY